MSAIMCALPKKLSGEYYCPGCFFSSYKIDDFAISMCWDCVFSEPQDLNNLTREEDMSKNDKLETVNWENLNNGDRIQVTAEVVVSSLDHSEGVIYVKGGGRIRAKKAFGSTTPVFDVKKIVSTQPDCWPVQKGDVWRDGLGKEYHVIHEASSWSSAPVKIIDETGFKVTEDGLKVKSGLVLAYRKGVK